MCCAKGWYGGRREDAGTPWCVGSERQLLLHTYIRARRLAARLRGGQIGGERDKSTTKIQLRGLKMKVAPGDTTPADYQIARVANANCPCAVFGFWGATAKQVGPAGATAFAGFTWVDTDP